MTQRQFASALFAALGMYIVVARLFDIGSMLFLVDELHPTMFIGVALYLLAGIALLWGHDWLSNRLFTDAASNASVSKVVDGGFAVVGCYFILSAAIQVFQPSAARWLWISQAVVGVALFLGSASLTRFWLAVRAGGVHAQVE